MIATVIGDHSLVLGDPAVADGEVAEKYSLDEMLERLGKTMKDMCEKLPDRYSTLKVRAELAQRTVEALKS